MKLDQPLVVQPPLREAPVPRCLAHLPQALEEMTLDEHPGGNDAG